jgi:hypothetical protein
MDEMRGMQPIVTGRRMVRDVTSQKSDIYRASDF